MKIIIKTLFLFLYIFIYTFPIQSKASECVILLHGIARSHSIMSKLEAVLRHHHYIVINQDYPSTKKPIHELANENLPPLINQCLKYKPRHISFVTHSMGGIVLQFYLQDHVIPKLGRIVMLSPPNHGSEVADLLHDLWLYKLITGPAGQELTTSKTSVPNQIHLNRQYQIGVIAGTFNLIPLGNCLFCEANDGAVSVSSAKTKIMKDFITVPVSHPFIMDDYSVQKQILNFLSYGKFFKCSSKRTLDGAQPTSRF